ncbi:DUF262 domain-containing protein [Paenibacillus sp. JJ-223]|uniref:DUF262 domain-containing protein n=1 Tax=Paenibacillus sp. JJ-223 TaxID=2905647 RepID=UPI001F283FDD|nr:DUF262 domain-containing protein [Paenibacillus sp. JJ-223]CAH1224440.1 hypothetical protein PAECIP111890_05666 [Paenibacillus sp. JJ-223]
MEFHSVQKSIMEIFSSEKRYIIPRFQREYSWTIDELTELWKDILVNITYENEKFTAKNYFVGSLVMVGNQNSYDLQVVDGQQRLTSITVLLSALVQTYKDLKEEKKARGCYKYIEGKTPDDDSYFRLENERSSNYIKQAIQNEEKKDIAPNTTEEKNLAFAYNFFRKKLKKQELIEEINHYTHSNKDKTDESYIDCITAVRNQVLAFKTIYITEPNEDEAYNIFETLNAKGLDLSMADLIKNQIFKVLKDQHPIDYAKGQWNILLKNLQERENQTDIKTFMRHFWISKYEHATEGKIYQSFIRRIPRNDKIIMKAFLDQLVTESQHYKTITSPVTEDWKQQQDVEIYQSLQALSVMRVVSPRPLLLSLLEGKREGKISLDYIKKALKAIEEFHFIFSTICSSSASGLESKYSRFARDIRNSNNKQDSHRIINELINDLCGKKPTYEEFQLQFTNKLRFSDSYTKEKKVIQYLFKKMERYYRSGNELEITNISIEHILHQSSGVEEAHSIGNLLPLSQELNTKCGSKNFKDKKKIYCDSQFKVVEEFMGEHHEKNEWTIEDINARTKFLADLAFNKIFTIY